MQESEFIWFNGRMLPWHEAKIHVLSHCLHYGSGVFEGIRFYNNQQGTVIFRLQDHLRRLLYSASVLKMEVPFSLAEIESAIKDLISANKLKTGYVRPIVFYGYEKLGVSPFGNPVEFAIACWPWGAYLPDGVKIKTSQYRRIHPASTDVKAKICGNYVNSVLASIELAGSGFDEALFLDTNDLISEGAGENFFIVKDKIIFTPKLGTILPGITRDTIFQLQALTNVTVIEKDITLAEAREADEAFFTGTAAEISWIRAIDHQTISAEEGLTTKLIRGHFQSIIRGEHPELPFLTYITMPE